MVSRRRCHGRRGAGHGRNDGGDDDDGCVSVSVSVSVSVYKEMMEAMMMMDALPRFPRPLAFLSSS